MEAVQNVTVNSEIDIIILEDDPIQLNREKKFLEAKGYSIWGHYISPSDVPTERLLKNPPHLAVLDLGVDGEDSSDLKGAEFGKILKTKLGIPIIYFTCRPQNHQEALMLKVPDGYVVKSDNFDTLLRTIEMEIIRYYGLIKSFTNVDFGLGKITVRENIETVKNIIIPHDKIKFLMAENNDVRLFTHGLFKYNFLVRSCTLGNFVNFLPDAVFCQIHKCYSVNLDSVCAYNNDKVFLEGTTLPLGKTYKENFIHKMKGKG